MNHTKSIAIKEKWWRECETTTYFTVEHTSMSQIMTRKALEGMLQKAANSV